MTLMDWIFLIFYGITLAILIPVLGKYMANVFQGHQTFLTPVFDGLEKFTYKICNINKKEEMNWVYYGKALLIFNVFGFIAVFTLMLFQGYLPLNPQNFSGTSLALAFNTAISFVTNTNWQAYSGETTLSSLTQMTGLSVQNFLSAATGMGALLALSRGISRKMTQDLGNFWVDVVRMVIYILLPLSIIFSLVLVSQGVVQTLSPYVEVSTLEGNTQVIPLGPVATQEAIKMLGTNGGGFFNANSAHPFENPTLFSNFLESLALILIPAATVYAFGLMINHRRNSYALLFVMFFIWASGSVLAFFAQNLQNPLLGVSPILEGIDTRMSVFPSVFWSVTTTATANGSVNAMISSLSPLVGGICLFNIMLGEMIFGGIGVGLCAMIMFTLLTLFLSGLMVGRTPEYLGKKIEIKEMQWVIFSVLFPGILILIGAGISCMLPEALSSLSHQGPHGLTELLYAFSSAAGNNGSAFAGLNADTPYFNIALGCTMLLGRCAIILPSLAIAGLLARKKITPDTSGTFSSNNILFIILLIAVIFIVGGLTFFPALCLGPLSEHLLLMKGRGF